MSPDDDLTVDEAHARYEKVEFADRTPDGLVGRITGLIDVRWRALPEDAR